MSYALPRIIQGGMGINVSSWPLAKAVSSLGQLGVVSGTAIDTIISRTLQAGDKDGAIRHALDNFPFLAIASRIKKRFFIQGGKSEERPYKGIGMPSLTMSKSRIELLVFANFATVFLAKEGHQGVVGINYLEKIQVPTLPSIYGAMLAGVDVILMGAGIPTAIPGILDNLARQEQVSLRIHADNNHANQVFLTHFNPASFADDTPVQLTRPLFLAIVSADIVARQMERRADGKVDGYIIENHTAGGHNAPPRRDRNQATDATPSFGEKDTPNLTPFRELNKPFWLAGQFSTPSKFREALEAGAHGVQIGTPFAYCNESGITRTIKDDVISQSVARSLTVETSFNASPTGYPFKLVHLENNLYPIDDLKNRTRICDMGYLRTAYVNENGAIGWRCPAEPVADFVAKGGTIKETEGRLCLCNGLTATVGAGQSRKPGNEPPILTAGEELPNLVRYLKNGHLHYSAADVINHILAPDT